MMLPKRSMCCTSAEMVPPCEMASRVGTDGTIAAVFPVIELHHFVFRGLRKTLGELVANDTEKWARVIRSAKIKIE